MKLKKPAIILFILFWILLFAIYLLTPLNDYFPIIYRDCGGSGAYFFGCRLVWGINYRAVIVYLIISLVVSWLVAKVVTRKNT
ncbi:hypothetical protein A3D84_05835 [Candidatus Woesebacteria bacterium RIFCSPHIGHO2_02_FULL_42_20]|nr:MAG: hypothetical protein A3D84_05835 [Candidatus Woesebacteria bacterium RIFCSPHIGHO2_02_FULL_42_20]